MTPLLRCRVGPQGGDEFEVDVTSRDVYMWERTGRDNSYAALMRQQDMVPLYGLIYFAARRTGQFEGDLEKFAETCDIEMVPLDDDEVAAASTPTRPARSTARRSRSR